MTISLTEPLE